MGKKVSHDWLTACEAAAYLRIHLVTLYSWQKEGRIKAGRAGRNWRFRKADLDAYLIKTNAAA